MKTQIHQKESGITLIVLVVTIVVILILAGITVDYALEDNGIIKTAQGLQNTINASVERDEQKLQELSNAIAEGSISGGSGLIPDSNSIEEGGSDGEDTDEPTPSSPTITVNGTQGEDGYYASDVQITFNKSDNLQTMTYKIDGVTEEITIQDGDSITITDDGTYRILAYMYNNQNVASNAATVQFVKDTVAPTATLQVTETLTDSVTVQIIATDSTSGLASSNPYTFYYKAEGETNWTTAGTGSASSYTYTGLQEGTTYTLKAEVTDRAGNVGISNEVENVQTEGNEDTTKPETGTVSEPTDTIITQGETTVIVLTPTEDVEVNPIKFIPVDENGNRIDSTVTAEKQTNGTIKITITAGTEEGTVNIQVQEGALTDKTGNTNSETTINTGVTIDNTKPEVGDITIPEGNDGSIQAGESVEIVITPSDKDITIDESKFVPVDKEGNEIDAEVNVEQDEDGNIHITVTPGETAPDGPVDLIIQEGAITDNAGNTNEEIKIEDILTIDNTKPSTSDIQKPEDGTVLAKGETIDIVITPSEDVTIDSSKIIISGEGSEGTNVQITENPDGTITITVTGGNGTGDVTVKIEEGFITDSAGNMNEETTVLQYETDNTAPTITSYQITGATTNSINVTVEAEDIGNAGIKPEGAYTYYISINQTFPTGTNTTVVTSNDTTYTFENLQPQVTYYTKVEVADNKDNTATSQTISHETGSIPEGQGTIGFTTLTWENGQVSTTVSKPSTLTSYTLQYQVLDAQGSTITDWTEVTGDSQEITGLLHGYTINARLADAAGNTGKNATLTIQDTTAPSITLTEQENTTQGNVTVTATITENESGIAVQKYAQGNQTTDYFQTAGTAFTGTTFEVTANGIWTVYVEDIAGNKIVQTIEVTKQDTSKPEIGDITKPEQGETQTGESSEIIISPSEDVTIDESKFIPVDKNENPIDATVTVEKDEDGNIHITVTPGENAPDGPVDLIIQEGAITDSAGNTNEEIKIEDVLTVDNTAPTIGKTDIAGGSEQVVAQGESITVTLTPAENVTIDPSKVIATGEGSTGASVQTTQNEDGTITITVTVGTGTGDIGIELQPGAMTDDAGNENVTTTIEKIAEVDNSAPTITVEVTSQTSSSITVTATAQDVGSAGLAIEDTYTYHITGEGVDKTITTTSSTCSFTDLPDGQEYTVTVTVKDEKGNTNTSAGITGKTENVPTGEEAITYSAISWANEQASLTISKPEDQTAYTLQYKVTDQEGTTITDWTPVTGNSQLVTGLLHGYTVETRLVDEAGNTGASIQQTIQDTVAPTMTLAEQEAYTQGNVTVTVTITENQSGIQVQKYAQGNQTADYFQTAGTEFTGSTFEATANGIWTVYVEDKGGNTAVETITVTKQDTAKPGIGDITIPEQGETQTGNAVEIVITPTEPDVTIDESKFIPVDKEENPIDATVNVEKDEDGNIHITVTPGENAPDGPVDLIIQEGAITDSAGNTNEEIKIENIITVDNTKPTVGETNITGGEGQVLKQGETLTVTITPNEDVTVDTTKFAVTGDGSEGSTIEVTENEDGSVTITITGGTGTGDIGVEIQEGAFTDSAGNTNETITLEQLVQVDNATPTVEAQVTAQTTSSITVAVTATDNGTAGLALEDTYTYHITGDGVDKNYTTTDTSYTFTNLPDKGEYTITVTAKDAKGNSATSTGITGNTETVPEGQGSVTASELTWNGNGTTTTQGTAKITLTNNQTDFSMQYQIITDGSSPEEANWINVTGDSIELDNLQHNTTIYTRLIDETGNTGTVGTTTIQDTTAPTAGILIMKENNQNGTDYTNNSWTNQNIYIDIDGGNDLQSGVQSNVVTTTTTNTVGKSITLPTTIETEGTTNLTVTTTDWAGLTATNTYTVNIDQTNPSISSLVASKTNPINPEKEDLTITGTAQDTLSGIIAYQYSTADNLTAQSTGWTTIDTTTESYTAPASTITSNAIYYFYVKDQAGNIEKQAIEISNIDTTAPTITALGEPSTTYIKEGQTATYSITTSEEVTLVDSTKATVTGTGSTNCSVSITGSGTSFTATVTGGTGNGEVTLKLTAGLFQDAAGNVTTADTTKTGLTIDNTAPTMTVSPASGTVAKSRTVTVSIEENVSGLADSNSYTYYLSTNATNPTATGYQSGTYTSGTPFNIGTGLTGEYYLFIPVVADKAGNTSTATDGITGYYRCGTYVFDNSAPTVTSVTLGNETTNGFTVTISASENGTAGIEGYTIYYKVSSASSYSNVSTTNTSYTFSNLEANTSYTVYVTVKDMVGNVSENSSTTTITTLTPYVPVEDGTWDSTKGVNGPYLYQGLNPVIWVDGTEIMKYADATTKTTINSAWTNNNGDKVWYAYKTGSGDHKTSQWANAVDTNGSYYVWIPRYEYKITKASSTTASDTNAGTIAVNFIAKSKTTPTSGYTIHPAFCSDVNKGGFGKELSGIWVAKYEACNVSSKPVSKPNTQSWRSITIGDCYTNSYNYNRDMDSHLLKNSEWGAVAYLTHSPYGRNGNEISINNSSSYYTGRSAGAPGSSSTSSSSAGSYEYNTTNGMLASTTGNITGVYDMSGGAWEYVAAWNTKSTSDYISSNGSSFASSGGSSTKYATAYSNGTSSNYPTSSTCILGDATYEVNVNPGSASRAWFNDYSYCANSTDPFFDRGGGHNNGSSAGVFFSGYPYGSTDSNDSFRVCLPGA